MSTMQAAVIRAFGGIEQLALEEVTCPQPQNDEVLVQVNNAGVNPVDCWTRQGSGVVGWLADPSFPLILGWDIAGTITAVGEGVTAFAPGDVVYGMIRFPQAGNAYAQFATAPVSDLALMPRTASFVQAAALPLAALTAWQSLFDGANLQGGETVVVLGAAGGVGHLGVQLARWKGAHVIDSTSTQNRAFVESLGAAEVIDYTQQPLATRGQVADVVFDTVGGAMQKEAVHLLKPGGRLITIVEQPDEDLMAEHHVTARHVIVHTSSEQLALIARLFDEHHLRVEIAQVVPLRDASLAHQQIESRHTRGKIVLSSSRVTLL